MDTHSITLLAHIANFSHCLKTWTKFCHQFGIFQLSQTNRSNNINKALFYTHLTLKKYKLKTTSRFLVNNGAFTHMHEYTSISKNSKPIRLTLPKLQYPNKIRKYAVMCINTLFSYRPYKQDKLNKIIVENKYKVIRYVGNRQHYKSSTMRQLCLIQCNQQPQQQCAEVPLLFSLKLIVVIIFSNHICIIVEKEEKSSPFYIVLKIKTGVFFTYF